MRERRVLRRASKDGQGRKRPSFETPRKSAAPQDDGVLVERLKLGVIAELGQLTLDLSDLIARNAAFSPHKPALVFEGKVFSYRAFIERIEAAAKALKAECGVSRGDRVAILSLNRPDYLVLLYACARLGAMLVPLNWRLAVAEQSFILPDASVKVLVLERAFAQILATLETSLP